MNDYQSELRKFGDAAKSQTSEAHAQWHYELADYIDRLQSELESLKRERAMLVETGKDYLAAEDKWRAGHEVDNDEWRELQTLFRLALSATEPQATQWLAGKLNEAKIEALEKTETYINSKYTANESIWICNDLHNMASELRLAASKRKEQV